MPIRGRRIRSRYLAGYVVALDVLLLLFVLPLQRYALAAAASPGTGAPLIMALLALNLLLLAATLAGGIASCGLTVRLALKGVRALRRRP